ncbi:MAG: hypothetical protein JXQ93_06425 [Flavobacteriaceae bacterium]
MTRKDFFKLVIKAISLFFLFSSLINFMYSGISYALTDYTYLSKHWYLGLALIPALIAFIAFIKADWIVKILKLEKGYDNETFNFGKLNATEIIKIAVIIIAFFLLIDNIPEFISHCFYSFKYSTEPKLYIDNSYKKDDYFKWTISGIKILGGYIMLTNYKRISKWIDNI